MKTSTILVICTLAALSFANNCFGTTLNLTPTTQFFIANATPYVVDHSYFTDGQTAYVKNMSPPENMGSVTQYTRSTFKPTPETGDLSRVEDISATLHIQFIGTADTGGCVSIIKAPFVLPRVIEYCNNGNDEVTVPITLQTNVQYNMEVNSYAREGNERLAEVHITLPPEVVIPSLTCSGFEEPLDSVAVKVRKHRALPLKASLIDSDGNHISDLSPPPRLQVIYSSDTAAAVDVTEDSLVAGLGSDGNQFIFDDGYWRFNLLTKNYSAPGTYNLQVKSGDADVYEIEPACSADFVIE